MKKYLVHVFLLPLFLIVFNSCKHESRALGVDVDLEVKKLSNGLRVIFILDPSVPVVSYQTWVQVGSIHEPAKKSGLAHLFEHLMFKGTEKYGPREFFLRLESKGSEVNAFTTRDYTVFYVNTIETLLDQVIELESDRLANFKIDALMLDNEKQIVFEERKMRLENNPEGQMQEALWREAFKVHPYGRPVIGEVEDLRALALEDAQDFFNSFYQPSNITLVVSGSFNKENVWKEIRKKYSSLSNRTAAMHAPVLSTEPRQTQERELTLNLSTSSSEFSIAYPICAAENKDSYALDVLASALFQGRSSRANKLWVENQKYLLNIGGVAYTPAQPGLFVIQGTFRKNTDTQQIKSKLDALIDEVVRNGVTDEELGRAIKNLTVQTIDSIKTPFGLGQLVGTVMMVFQDPLRFESDIGKYLNVKSDDVVTVAKKYLIPQNRTAVFLIPENKK